jgi:hypothetical protein
MQDNQKLSPSEIEKLKVFIARYSEMYNKVEELSTRVESIDKEKNDMLGEINAVTTAIEEIRLAEIEFQKDLVAKYGDFHLNVETFEIQPHKK